MKFLNCNTKFVLTDIDQRIVKPQMALKKSARDENWRQKNLKKEEHCKMTSDNAREERENFFMELINFQCTHFCKQQRFASERLWTTMSNAT